MDDESLSGQLDETAFHHGLFDDRQVFKQPALQNVIPDVARRHQHQAQGAAGDYMGVDEVGILRDDGPPFPVRERNDVAIWRSVAGGEIERVDSIVPRRNQAPRRRRGSIASRRNLMRPAAGCA